MSRPSECFRAPRCQVCRVSSPMADLVALSRTTTKTQGCEFSALGAWMAAVSTRATDASSTVWSVKARQARW